MVKCRRLCRGNGLKPNSTPNFGKRPKTRPSREALQFPWWYVAKVLRHKVEKGARPYPSKEQDPSKMGELLECPSCRRSVRELFEVTPTHTQGYFPSGTRVCSSCLENIRYEPFQVEDEDP